MFHYTPVPEDVLKRQRLTKYPPYVQVLYNDPDPILGKEQKHTACFMTEKFKGFDQQIKDFSVRKDDVFIITYPKSGTTFMSELVTVLQSGMDFKKLEETKLIFRSPFLEVSALMDYPFDLNSVIEEMTTSRVLKTHLPLNLLPNAMMIKSNDGHKMIYVARNPKDAVISQFHHFKNIHGYVGSLTDMMEGYLEGEILYGSYFRHVDEYVRVSKIRKNLLIVRYEDMVDDMGTVIGKLSDFLDIPLGEMDKQTIAAYVHFDQMKNRKGSNHQDFVEALASAKEFKQVKHAIQIFSKMPNNCLVISRFLRKGKRDSYKEEMPQQFVEKFNQEMKKWKGVMELYPEF